VSIAGDIAVAIVAAFVMWRFSQRVADVYHEVVHFFWVRYVVAWLLDGHDNRVPI